MSRDVTDLLFRHVKFDASLLIVVMISSFIDKTNAIAQNEIEKNCAVSFKNAFSIRFEVPCIRSETATNVFRDTLPSHLSQHAIEVKVSTTSIYM